jgi:hypothetical protein
MSQGYRRARQGYEDRDYTYVTNGRGPGPRQHRGAVVAPQAGLQRLSLDKFSMPYSAGECYL